MVSRAQLPVLQPLSLTLEKARIDYERDGYARIEGVYTPAEMQDIKAQAYACIYRLPENDPNKLQTRIDASGRERPALLFWPSSMDETLKYYATGNRLKSIATFFLGEDIRWLNNQIYYRESGDGDQFAWHQDICFRTPPEDFENIEDGYLQTVIVVDEVRSDNGPVEFILGSHKFGDMGLIPRDDSERGLRKFVRGTWEGQKSIANPGDVLIWSVMTIHGSERNDSGRDRMHYMNGFARESAIKNKSKFPVYCAKGV